MIFDKVPFTRYDCHTVKGICIIVWITMACRKSGKPHSLCPVMLLLLSKKKFPDAFSSYATVTAITSAFTIFPYNEKKNWFCFSSLFTFFLVNQRVLRKRFPVVWQFYFAFVMHLRISFCLTATGLCAIWWCAQFCISLIEAWHFFLSE